DAPASGRLGSLLRRERAESPVFYPDAHRPVRRGPGDVPHRWIVGHRAVDRQPEALPRAHGGPRALHHRARGGVDRHAEPCGWEGALAPVLVLAGPTAAGKTDAAIEVALKFEAVIVSADAMQV